MSALCSCFHVVWRAIPTWLACRSRIASRLRGPRDARPARFLERDPVPLYFPLLRFLGRGEDCVQRDIGLGSGGHSVGTLVQ